jgi:hypothetical protein
VTWQALELTGRLDRHETDVARRAALSHAARWLGTLPPRLAIEQTAALDVVADTLRHDRNAVQRTFRARYWQREPNLHPSLQIEGLGR